MKFRLAGKTDLNPVLVFYMHVPTNEGSRRHDLSAFGINFEVSVKSQKGSNADTLNSFG